MGLLFTTPRLLFKHFEPGDGHLLYTLNSDPEVVKYLHEPPTTLQNAADIIRDIILPQYSLYNHGRWALYLSHDQQFIGWCGLKYRVERNEVDLGYRLMKKFWGKGYATEAALASIQYGFDVLQLSHIFAAAHIQNIASQKVLEKVGMVYQHDELIDGCLAKTYKILSKQHT